MKAEARVARKFSEFTQVSEVNTIRTTRRIGQHSSHNSSSLFESLRDPSQVHSEIRICTIHHHSGDDETHPESEDPETGIKVYKKVRETQDLGQTSHVAPSP